MTEQTTTIHVACLCAAWCRLCDDYAPVLARAISELAFREAALRVHWIDIEDEADLVGDFDVETFPTIVVLGPEGVRFAGALAPHADTLRWLLEITTAEPPMAGRLTAASAEVEAFATRLRDRFNNS